MTSVPYATRSGRQVKQPNFLAAEIIPPSTGWTRQNRPRADPAPTPQQEFLATLYSEIFSAACATTSSLPVPRLTEVQTLLRIARTSRFVNGSSNLKNLQFPNLTHRRVAIRKVLETIVADAHARDSQQSLRLEQCVSRLGYLVLSICLFSDEFREALLADDDEVSLTWSQKLDEISARSASLELFALTRGLDYLSPIRYSDSQFQTFLDNRTTQLEGKIANTTTNKNLGIKRGDCKARHRVSKNECNPHVWQLDSDPTVSASRTSIKYDNNARLKKEFPQESTVKSMTKKQEDIDDSIVLLEQYQWPGQSHWPEPDPRYAGFDSDPCIDCGKENEYAPKIKGSKQSAYERCDCTISSVRDTGERPVLVELFSTERVGTGIRALEAIETGQILDAYLGEVYPLLKKNGARYGLGDGSAYRFVVPMQNPHAKQRQRSKTGKGTRSSEGHKEVESFVIDSALKGNWTRYINHSCDYNTIFKTENVGMRSTVLIEAVRPIQFGEEITITYGDNYFPNQNHGCKCGAAKCVRWNEQNLRSNRITLEKAIERGNAPGWAVTADGKARPGIAVPRSEKDLHLSIQTRATSTQATKSGKSEGSPTQTTKQTAKDAPQASARAAAKKAATKETTPKPRATSTTAMRTRAAAKSNNTDAVTNPETQPGTKSSVDQTTKRTRSKSDVASQPAAKRTRRGK